MPLGVSAVRQNRARRFSPRDAIPQQAAAAVAVALAATVLTVLIGVAVSRWGIALSGVGICGALACVWLAATAHPGRGGIVVFAYLSLLDGPVRLVSGVQQLVLVRDALLYSFAAGLLFKAFGSRDRLALPANTAWIGAFVSLVAIQLLNPSNGSIGYAVVSMRSHLEWLPLFFIGALLCRSRGALGTVLSVLVVLTAINGIASLIQFHLTPDEFSRWGPGYKEFLSGTNDYGVGARVVFTDSGQLVRPFALGSDSGFGGLMGMLAAPAVIGLIMLRRGALRWVHCALAVGVVLAVLTSQSRSAVVASVVAVAGFMLMLIAAGRAGRTMQTAAVIGIVAFIVIVPFTRQTPAEDVGRYTTVAPGSLVGTLASDRGNSLFIIPKYLAEFPFGGGLGSTGYPVAKLFGHAGTHQALNAETEFTFLLAEVGIAGLVLLLALTGKLIVSAIRTARSFADRDASVLFSAAFAPLFGILASWAAFPVTTKPPTGPYFWFLAGVVSWWATSRPSRQPVPTLRDEPGTRL